MKYFIIFIMIFFVNSAFAFDTVKVQNPYTQSEKVEQYPISKDEFKAIEMKIFNKIFDTDSSKTRLERLEKELFGMVQSGDEEERFENIITASDYYQSGYRKSKVVDMQKFNENNSVKSSDFITNYNFDDVPEYSESPIYDDNSEMYEDNYKNKKQSKIVKFFSDITDILSSGVVTGYTLPMSSFGYTPFSTVNTIGGSDFSALPQFPVYMPHMNRKVKPYRFNRSPYANRYRHPYTKQNYAPHGNGSSRYQSGSSVKIIY